MGFDLDSLALDEATTVVSLYGQEAKVSYRPTGLTANHMARMNEAAEKDETGPFIKMLAEILCSWDVTKGGEVVPIEPDPMGELPLVLLRAIFLGILKDLSQGEAPSPSSDG